MEFVPGLHAVKCGMCHLQFINVVLHLLCVPGDTSIMQLKVMAKQNRAISKQMRSLFGIKRPEKKKKKLNQFHLHSFSKGGTEESGWSQADGQAEQHLTAQPTRLHNQ